MLLSSRGIKMRATASVAAGLVLLIAAAALAGRADAVTYEPAPFCEPTTVRDWLKPFERMSRLHQPRQSGKVDFGPANLRLRATPQLLVGGGAVGFRLGLEQRNGLILLWKAKTTIVEVDRNGFPIGRPQQSIKRVDFLDPALGREFQAQVSRAPAFYRSTIVFSGVSGQELGKFSFYTRVVKPSAKAHLGLDASVYRPGGSVFMRVENPGSLAASYGVDYNVEKLEGGNWIEAPESPRGPIIMLGITAPPGMTGPCNIFLIPPTMAPGSYRISKRVGFKIPPGSKVDKHSPARRPDSVLIAQFEIVA
jgi:hypothetical protein